MWWTNDWIYSSYPYASNIEVRNQWAIKFPLDERPANWAKCWSKFTNKTRQQVIQESYRLNKK